MWYLKLVLSSLLLAGCGSVRPASVAGECKVFRAPTEVIQGVRVVDRKWIAGTVEVGVRSCGWRRPKA